MRATLLGAELAVEKHIQKKDKQFYGKVLVAVPQKKRRYMQLIKWDKIRTAIETTKDIETLTKIKDRLRAYQMLAELSKASQDVQAKITIYKARADRKCGEWLAENVGAALCGCPVTAETLWPNVPPGERTLWNANLYPVVADREESLRLALPLQAPCTAPPGWRTQWQAAPRLSLASSFARADSERILADLADVEDHVAGRRFYAAIETERPAAEAKELLGAVPATVARRGQRVGAWLSQADAILRLRGYKALAVATGETAWEDRAFATLAEMIQTAVSRRGEPVCSPISHSVGMRASGGAH